MSTKPGAAHIAHLEIRIIAPERAPLPITATGAEKQAAATPELRALCDRFLREPWQRLAALA